MRNILKFWFFVALLPVSGNPATFTIASIAEIPTVVPPAFGVSVIAKKEAVPRFHKDPAKKYVYKFDIDYVAQPAPTSLTITGSPTRIAKWHCTPPTHQLPTITQNNSMQFILKAGELKTHLESLITSGTVLQELSRILFAQDVRGHDNIPANNEAGYAIGKEIHFVCKGLKEHMLKHGHLGYYPEFSYVHDSSPTVVSRREARGIFNIPYSVSKRIAQDQRRKKHQRDQFYSADSNPSFPLDHNKKYRSGYTINEDVHHLWPNIESSQMFQIDPGVSRPKDEDSVTTAIEPNLETVADGLIDLLLTAGPATTQLSVLQVKFASTDKDKFSITATYTATGALQDAKGNAVTQDENIGVNLNGAPTSTVQIIVRVMDGVVSIVSMYPV